MADGLKAIMGERCSAASGKLTALLWEKPQKAELDQVQEALDACRQASLALNALKTADALLKIPVHSEVQAPAKRKEKIPERVVASSEAVCKSAQESLQILAGKTVGFLDIIKVQQAQGACTTSRFAINAWTLTRTIRQNTISIPSNR